MSASPLIYDWASVSSTSSRVPAFCSVARPPRTLVTECLLAITVWSAGVLLGYGNLSEPANEQGVTLIAQALAQVGETA